MREVFATVTRLSSMMNVSVISTAHCVDVAASEAWVGRNVSARNARKRHDRR